MAGISIDLVEADFSGSESGPDKATPGQDERRPKKPVRWHAGPLTYSKRNRKLDSDDV